ncbi:MULTISPECIES: NAD(P)-dependent oxidoreductase [Delftia]|nr:MULTISPECIES: NAD(P)-dependent oxidoreductase [Delftia]MBB1648991.1 hypothetical protein [Delftia sp. UME58]
MEIGFIGAGLMGAPMIRRLIDAGHSVRVWNRTAAKAEALREHGAEVVLYPGAVAAGAQIVIAIIENGAAIHEVLFAQGLASQMHPGQVMVDMSSIAPEQAVDIGRQLERLGIAYIDAPISGGPDGAQAGTMAIMAGGGEAALAIARPALQCMGRLTHVGPLGAGQTTKLLNQTITSTTIAAISEIMVLARQLGLEPARVCEALSGGFADSKVLQIHGKRMAERNFVPGGHVRTFLKDLNHAASLIAGLGLQLPVADLARSHFAELASTGHAQDDISAIVLVTESHNTHALGPNPGQ